MNDDKTSPLICDIKQNSLDDGPGIRTVFFFKGCTLDCSWCQNPETKSFAAELVFQPARCISCDPCAVHCSAGAFVPRPCPSLARESCTRCFDCVNQCPAHVFKGSGDPHDVANIIKVAVGNRTFYQNSGGGITLSGGEPLAFARFARDLVTSLAGHGINTVIETAGNIPLNDDSFETIRSASLLYYDIKFIQGQMHRAYCGVDNKRVISNFEYLIENKVVRLPETKGELDFKHRLPDVTLLIPRMPLVPGITTTQQNMADVATYLSRNHVKVMDLLPYNPLWLEKASSLGMNASNVPNNWCSRDVLDGARDAFRGFTFDRFK